MVFEIPYKGVDFQPLVQANFHQPMISCISSRTHILPCHDHASYCCILPCIDCTFGVFSVVCSASEDIHEYPAEGQYPSTDLPGKQPPLIIRIQTHSLAPALVYCIKTRTFQLLFAAVVEPLSSAWPVIARVNSWNPLACVGVDWAMIVFPTLMCLLCLESCQVWFIWVMG
jgi:hypothetical protein